MPNYTYPSCYFEPLDLTPDTRPDYVTNNVELADWHNISGPALTLDDICPFFLDELTTQDDKQQRQKWRDWKAQQLRRQKKEKWNRIRHGQYFNGKERDLFEKQLQKQTRRSAIITVVETQQTQQTQLNTKQTKGPRK